jgi:hypothetical protein
LANPAAVTDVMVMNVHRTPSWALSCKEGMGQNSSLSDLMCTPSFFQLIIEQASAPSPEEVTEYIEGENMTTEAMESSYTGIG